MLTLLAWLMVAAFPSAADPPAFDDTVTVTASRRERPSAEVAASVTVLRRDDLAASASATLDDTLRRVPGFSLFRRSSSRNTHPTTQGASLRGIAPSGTSRVLVLLDGVPVNDPFGGWVSWSRLPRAGLERVEVARGVGSELWGSDALGGVVQLVTSPPVSAKGRTRAGSLRTELGERGERHAELAAGAEGGGWSGLVDARFFESDGFRVVKSDQRGAIDVPAATEQASLYARARRDLGRSAQARGGLEARLNLFDEDRGNGTPLTVNGSRGGFLALAWDTVASPRHGWRASVAGYLQDFHSTFSSQAADRASERPALDQFDVDSEAWRAELEWRRDVRGAGTSSSHSLTGGAEIRFADASTAEDFFYSEAAGGFLRRRRAGGTRRLTSAFLQDEIPLGERWTVTLAARADSWRAGDGFRREIVLADGAVSRDDRFDDRRETTLSPRVAAVLRAAPRWTVHGALYRTFRAPTINELYRPFRVRNDITAANAELDPETLTGAELGAAFRGGRLDLRVALFHNRLEDAVANLTVGPGPGVVGPCGFVPAGGTCRQRRNLDESRVRGLEAALTWRLSGPWTATASWLLSDTEVRRALDAPRLVGKRLPQVPEQRLILAVDRRPEDLPLSGRLQVRWSDALFEDDLNTRELASAVLVDLTLGWRLATGFELFAAAENLFDREVEVGETAEGLVTVGAPRLVRGGLRWRW